MAAHVIDGNALADVSERSAGDVELAGALATLGTLNADPRRHPPGGTPEKAIGFLFIPILNIYWAFQFLWGWAKDYNSLVERHGLNAPRLPAKLFLTYVILAFTAWIPMLNLVIVSVNYFVGMAMVEHICDGINAIPPQLKHA